MAAVALARCGNDDRAAAPSLPSPPAQLGAAVPPVRAPEPTAVAIDAAVALEPTHELGTERPGPAAAKPRAKPRPREHKDDLYDDRN